MSRFQKKFETNHVNTSILLGSAFLVGLFFAFADFLFHSLYTSPPEVFGYYLVLVMTGFIGAVVGFISQTFLARTLIGASTASVLKGVIYYYANATNNYYLTCCNPNNPLTVFGVTNYWFAVTVESFAHFILFAFIFILVHIAFSSLKMRH